MKDMLKIQKDLSEYAVKIAKPFGFKLDYSHNSIKDVETVLGYIHEEYIKDGNEDGLDGVALEYAFYIGSVIQKEYGIGYFERDHEEFGAHSYPFYIKDSVAFPHTWCLKRIYNGPEDNVWSKYSILIMDKIGKDLKSEKKGIIEYFKGIFNRG